MIPHNKPTPGKEEAAAAARVLRSRWVAQGFEVKKFEDAVCRYLGLPAGHAVAASSGTASLYLTLTALNVRKGSEVIIPSYVCSAVLNAVNMTGATPVLADIEPDTLNISFADVKKKINPTTAAIVVTHTFGMPADVPPFMELGVLVIEDCAQAIGASVGGRSVGITGTVAIFSFYATKMITTGYGGMVASKDEALIERVRDYREFDGRQTYEPRFNFQMSDINAAIGLAQLKKLPAFLKKRAAAAKVYAAVVPADSLWPEQGNKTAKPNLYRILVRTERAKELKEFLGKKGVSTIIPIEQFELLHRYLHEDPEQFPESEAAAENLLSLPAYPSLSPAELRKISAALREFFGV